MDRNELLAYPPRTGANHNAVTGIYAHPKVTEAQNFEAWMDLRTCFPLPAVPKVELSVECNPASSKLSSARYYRHLAS